MQSKSSVSHHKAELPPLEIPLYEPVHPRLEPSIRLAYQMKKEIEQIELRHKTDVRWLEDKHLSEVAELRRQIKSLEEKIASNRRMDLEREIEELKEYRDGKFTIKYLLRDKKEAKHYLEKIEANGFWNLIKTIREITQNNPWNYASSVTVHFNANK